MYIRTIFWCLLLVVAVHVYAGNRIYKWVDDAGQTYFSDRPIAGARSQPLSAVNTSPINSQTETTKNIYTNLELVRPKDAQDFRTELEEIPIEVLVFIEPSLQPGHQFQLVLDDNLVPGAFNTTKIRLNIATGTHKLYVQVIDADNKVQKTSQPVQFIIRQKIRPASKSST